MTGGATPRAAQAPPPGARTRWQRARTEQDLPAMEKLARRLAAAGDMVPTRVLARMYDARGEPARALPLWRALAEGDARDFEAAFHGAAAGVAAGLDAAAAVAAAAPAANPLLCEHLLATLREPHAQPDPPPPFRHIAICGVSYCGSTLMDRILGSVPGAASIGESHWLVKWQHGDTRGDIDFSLPLEQGQLFHCSVCGPRCGVLTLAFRRALAADRTHWYRRIAAQLGTAVLVSSDKNPPKLVDNDPLLDLQALVLFKSPRQAWLSWRDKLPASDAPGFHLDACQRFLQAWARTYRTYLQHCNPRQGKVFLQFDAFVAAPDRHLRRLLALLDLPDTPQVLAGARPGHAIGGNDRAMRRLREADYRIAIRPLPPEDLPAPELALVDGFAEAQDVHQALRARFHTDFG